MRDLDLTGLPQEAAVLLRPFAEETASKFSGRLVSLTVIGSCLTGDFIPGVSDINSVLVLPSTTVSDLDTLSKMGRYSAKRRIRVPIVMTRDYIQRSLDAFPVEFLDMKLFHKTVAGMDLFSDLVIERNPLRLQCERDIKAKLINLARGYVSCRGRARAIRILLLEAMPGYIAILRAMLFLLQGSQAPPGPKALVLSHAEAVFGVPMKALRDTMGLKTAGIGWRHGARPNDIFKELHGITHDLSAIMDNLPG
jgi:hypothetical protein